MRKINFVASVIVGLAGAFCAHAQPWPSKTVKIVAPFPPGGSVDQVARILAAQLAAQTGQQFIVENRAGASGVIGTQAIAAAPPDGYTWGVVFDTHAVNPSLQSAMPFDTMKDVSHVMMIGTAPMAIVAHKDQPYRDFADVLQAAKKTPVAVGSIGTGSLGHLALAQIAASNKVEFNHIPYKGGGPLMTDAIGGQVPLAIGSLFLVTPHVKAGKVKALAVTSSKPSTQLPEARPVAQQGVAGFEALAWWAYIGPAKLPADVLKAMCAQLAAALKNPAVAEKLAQQGMDIGAGECGDAEKFVRGEMERWGKVVRENRIKAGD